MRHTNGLMKFKKEFWLLQPVVLYVFDFGIKEFILIGRLLKVEI